MLPPFTLSPLCLGKISRLRTAAMRPAAAPVAQLRAAATVPPAGSAAPAGAASANPGCRESSCCSDRKRRPWLTARGGTEQRRAGAIANGWAPDRQRIADHRVAAGQLLRRQERKTRPYEPGVCPRDAPALFEQCPHRHRTGHIAKVVAATQALFDTQAHVVGQITHIDELEGICRAAGRQHVAAL